MRLPTPERWGAIVATAEELVRNDICEDPDRVGDATDGYLLAVMVIGPERERELSEALGASLTQKG